jgi:hypothetical protein
LQLRYIGPFKIVQRIGKVVYRLDLPSELRGVHDMFRVSQLRQYLADPYHVVNDELIKLMSDLNYEERPIQILEYGEKQLRQKRIPLGTVLWNHHPMQDAAWETEKEMR